MGKKSAAQKGGRPTNDCDSRQYVKAALRIRQFIVEWHRQNYNESPPFIAVI
jgi:hypothetical protein